METNINDNAVVNIQEVFNLIRNGKYEEAFLLSSKITDRGDTQDQLFHEWIKSLTEFYSCNNKETAIQLLEKIKPAKLENEIHFRIFNSLMVFYTEIEDEQHFREYKEKLIPELYMLNNSQLLAKIFGNIANCYYIFKNYKESIEYCEKAIKISQQHKFFDITFLLTTMIKIMNLFYLGDYIKANKLKDDLEILLRMIENLEIKKYLDKAIDKFNREVKLNENVEKTL